MLFRNSYVAKRLQLRPSLKQSREFWFCQNRINPHIERWLRELSILFQRLLVLVSGVGHEGCWKLLGSSNCFLPATCRTSSIQYVGIHSLKQMLTHLFFESLLAFSYPHRFFSDLQTRAFLHIADPFFALLQLFLVQPYFEYFLELISWHRLILLFRLCVPLFRIGYFHNRKSPF